MSFKEEMMKRMVMGAKEYGVDTWKEKTTKEIIEDMQEELVDAANYAAMVTAKGKDLDRYIIVFENIYNDMEEIKNVNNQTN